MSTSFFERNRTAIIAGLAVATIAGGALYYSSTTGHVSEAQRDDHEHAGSPTPAGTKKKHKKKKKSSSKKSTQLSHGFPTTQDGPDGPVYPVIDDFNKVKLLQESERKELGDEFKIAGNHAFNHKDFKQALELYSKAVECNGADPIYYSNRAAVYGSLQDYPHVVSEATKALELRPDYIKCYSRRGLAFEKLESYSDAVMDFTAACILTNFQEDSLSKSVDRGLKLLAEQIVDERFKDGPATSEFPSPSFISAYLTSFHKRELPESVVNSDEGSGDYELKLAFDAMDKENLESYKQAVDHFENAIRKGPSTPEGTALAYEYRGTFRFLLNDVEGAMNDINTSLEHYKTAQAMIKLSSLHIELGKLDEAAEDFKQAEQLDPNCSDIHYQLAQLSFLHQDWATAVANYEKAIAADDSFMLAHIQLAVTKYRMGETQVATDSFKKLVSQYPESSHAHNYYGEILLDLKDNTSAIREFDRAIELEKSKRVAAINVLPFINKALALVQTDPSPSTIEQAVDLCKKAVALDPASDVAIGSLAQFYLQQGNTKEAIELFERNAVLARTRAEQIQAITFAEAARTQFRINQERPVLRERLELLSRYNR